MNRKGPEPSTSVSGALAGCLARRSGITTSGKLAGLARPSSTAPSGSFSVSVKLAGPVAFQSAPALARMRPMLSRPIQRCTEATASAAVTGLPSLNFRPGRSVKVQLLPSLLVVYLSTICGRGVPAASCANRVS